MATLFKIKICGVTTPEDARAAFQLGADMIGLNFYEESPRFVTPDQARKIASVVPASTGVFVNASAAEINDIAKRVGLNWVQLHGDEPAALLADIHADFQVIRVRCLGHQGLEAIRADLEECESSGRAADALLVDATVPGEFGGTGKTVDWPALKGHHEELGDIPLILAGGLHGENVGQAIKAVAPFAVDTASGVESAAGVKDRAKMQSFIHAAKSCF